MNIKNARGTPVVYFQAFGKQFTVLGVEKKLFFLLLGCTLPIITSSHFSLSMLIVALVAFGFMHVAGILITRADSQMVEIYKQHIHYKRYYSAISGINAKIRPIKPSVPVYEGKRGLV
jgi:hypothetical protein